MDGAIDARPTTSAVPPSIVRPPNSRRRSLPSSSEHGRTRTRSANHVRNQPASPEVISSLIDSLSNISAPAQQHFENLPTIHGVSASVPASPMVGSFGVEYGSMHPRSSTQGDAATSPDDGAEFPIIRMAKPPSGYSPLTASKLAKSGSSGSLRKSFNRIASRSQTSLCSAKADPHPDTTSTENVSADTPSKRQSSGTSRESSESRSRSREGVRGLFYKSSRDRLRDMDGTNRKNLTISVSPPETNHLSIPSPNTSQPSSPRSPKRQLFVDTPIQEEPSSHPPGLRSPESPLIPDRASSLRKSVKSPSHKPRGRKTNANSRSVSPVKETGKNSEPKIGSDEYAVKRTTKRIEQLKKQKEMRDRDSLEVSQDPPPAETGQPRSHSMPPPAVASSGVYTTPEKPPTNEKHPLSKAHKVLGLEGDSEPRRSLSLNNSPAHHSHDDSGVGVRQRTSISSRKRPESTISLDYRNALEALDRLSSADGTSTSSGGKHRDGTHGRRRSVGGRSAAGRKANDSLVERRTSIGGGRTSAEGAPKLNTSGRWSHPEASLKVDQRGSLKTIQSPVSPTSPREPFDERPSSSDSVDDDVDSFLTAPRLSQKVKHPQTGRVIAFSEVGDPEGFAVFCCVGMGLTRYIAAFYDELAISLKLRIITPDRPGIGGSQRYSDGSGTPLSWPGKSSTLQIVY
jgi:hypothetical protein